MSDKLLQIAIALLSHEPGARVTIKGGPEMGIRALDYLISLATQAKMRLRGETQNAAAGHHRAVPATRASERVPAAATPRDGEGQPGLAPIAGLGQNAPPSPPNRSVQGRHLLASRASATMPAAAAPTRQPMSDQRRALIHSAAAPVLAMRRARLSDGSDLAGYRYNTLLDKRQANRRDAFLIDNVLALGIPADRNILVSEYVTAEKLAEIAGRPQPEQINAA